MIDDPSNISIFQHAILKSCESVRPAIPKVGGGQYLSVKGEYTSLYYVINGSSISFWRHNERAALAFYSFGPGCEVVDACYLPFKDGSHGVAVAVNNVGTENISCVAYCFLATASIVRKILIPNKIYCISAILDNQMQTEIRGLHSNFHNLPHLIAVGTSFGCCLLTHFGVDMPSSCEDTSAQRPSFSTDLCKNHKRSGNIEIRKSGNIHRLGLSGVHVTAILYIHQRKLTVVGLSNGAFVTVGMSDNPWSAIYWYSESPIYGFAYQEAVDDPRQNLFLWIAFSSNPHRASNCRFPHTMLVVMHLSEDNGSFCKPILTPQLMWVPSKQPIKWLSFRTVHQRSNHDLRSQSFEQLNRSSSFQSSQSSSASDTSLLLMTWKEKRCSDFRGAIFDLNAFYSKRMPKKIVYDGTVAHQNAFLSKFIFWKWEDDKYGSPCDVMIAPYSIHRFISPWTDCNEVLHFSSSKSFSMCTFTTTHICYINVRSIQEEVLNFIECNIDVCLQKKRKIIFQWVDAVGLIDLNSLHGRAKSFEVSMILSALLYHGKCNAVEKWISECANSSMICAFGRSLWQEVEIAKSRLDDIVKPLFEQTSYGISKFANLRLRSAACLFSSASSLFIELIKKTGFDKEVMFWQLSKEATINLHAYSQLLLFSLDNGLLPEDESSERIRKDIQALESNRKSVASHDGYTPWLTQLLQEIRTASSDSVSLLQTIEFYPPSSILDLFPVLLSVKLNFAAKYKLLGYYLLDYGHSADKSLDLFNQFSKLLSDPPLSSQIHDKWSLDNGFEVNVRTGRSLAVKRSHEKKFSQDQPMTEICNPRSNNINNIRDKMLKQENGVSLWNRFCITHKYFDRLIMPKNVSECDGWQRNCDLWTRRIFASLPKYFITSSSTRRGDIPTAKGKEITTEFGKMGATHTVDRTKKSTFPSSSVGSSAHESEHVAESVGDISPVNSHQFPVYEKLLGKEKISNMQQILSTPSRKRQFTSETAFSTPRTPEKFTSVQSILKSAKGESFREATHTPGGRHLRFDLDRDSLKEYCESDFHPVIVNSLLNQNVTSSRPVEISDVSSETGFSRSFEQEDEPDIRKNMEPESSFGIHLVSSFEKHGKSGGGSTSVRLEEMIESRARKTSLAKPVQKKCNESSSVHYHLISTVTNGEECSDWPMSRSYEEQDEEILVDEQVVRSFEEQDEEIVDEPMVRSFVEEDEEIVANEHIVRSFEEEDEEIVATEHIVRSFEEQSLDEILTESSFEHEGQLKISFEEQDESLDSVNPVTGTSLGNAVKRHSTWRSRSKTSEDCSFVVKVPHSSYESDGASRSSDLIQRTGMVIEPEDLLDVDQLVVQTEGTLVSHEALSIPSEPTNTFGIGVEENLTITIGDMVDVKYLQHSVSVPFVECCSDDTKFKKRAEVSVEYGSAAKRKISESAQPSPLRRSSRIRQISESMRQMLDDTRPVDNLHQRINLQLNYPRMNRRAVSEAKEVIVRRGELVEESLIVGGKRRRSRSTTVISQMKQKEPASSPLSPGESDRSVRSIHSSTLSPLKKAKKEKSSILSDSEVDKLPQSPRGRSLNYTEENMADDQEEGGKKRRMPSSAISPRKKIDEAGRAISRTRSFSMSARRKAKKTRSSAVSHDQESESTHNRSRDSASSTTSWDRENRGKIWRTLSTPMSSQRKPEAIVTTNSDVNRTPRSVRGRSCDPNATTTPEGEKNSSNKRKTRGSTASPRRRTRKLVSSVVYHDQTPRSIRGCSRNSLAPTMLEGEKDNDNIHRARSSTKSPQRKAKKLTSPVASYDWTPRSTGTSSRDSIAETTLDVDAGSERRRACSANVSPKKKPMSSVAHRENNTQRRTPVRKCVKESPTRARLFTPNKYLAKKDASMPAILEDGGLSLVQDHEDSRNSDEHGYLLRSSAKRRESNAADLTWKSSKQIRSGRKAVKDFVNNEKSSQ